MWCRWAKAGTHDPFAAEVKDGMLYGRGAADMKSAIAAFVAAAARHRRTPKGSISLLITGDEEGAAVNGTVKLLEWLKERGETIDHCVVGEPTSVGAGRRHAEDRPPRLDQFQGHGHAACRAMSAIRKRPRTRFRCWPNW